MNYQKLDAALASAINQVQNSDTQSLTVFIHTEPVLDATAIAVLENFGVNDVTPGKNIFTATLSANAISQLSAQPWVQQIRLSQQLNFVNTKLNFKKLSV
ncbi:hypothetical protein NIES22_48030 [Calothrix brevissima NIES-22]|nr:hypothetical protein NIES22_48030 [Calothrix brevissima NIES-22]